MVCSYTVIKTGILNRDQSMSLLNLEPFYDFWKEPRNGEHAIIMSPPEHKKRLYSKLRNSNVEFKVTIPNVEK
jgi:hypothetical protein